MVHIVSPVDGQAVAGGLLSVVVEFSAKLNSKGQPSGNVTHVDLLVNGHVFAVYQNPPNIKSGTHTFVVDLSPFGPGPIQFSAVAYQGEGSSAPSESSSGVTVQIDTVPPVITGATPANGSLGISGSVEVRADLFDAGSGIDSPATRLTLDGNDVTASSTRTTSRVSYLAVGLLDGPHAVKVDAADRAGNPAHLEWGFLLDLTDPFDVFTQPAEDVTVSTGRPMLTLSYSDPAANGYASGIDPATLEWFEDGRDVTAETVRGSDSATYTPPADRPLSEGEHHYLAIVHDRAGRTHSAERIITVHIAPPPSVAIVLPGAITPLYAPPYLFTFTGTAPVTPTFARVNGVDVLDRFQVTDTFAGYIPEVGDPVFLHAGPNLFEVGVVDGSGVAASAAKIIGLVSGPGPATVPLVLTLKTGIALHAVSHRPTPLIELVAQAGLGGAAVPGVALSAEFPGGFVQDAPPLSLNTNDLGFAGLYCVPGALTGTENSEVVHLTIRAKDFPDATPLDVPVTVYRPTLEVTFSVPEHSEESAQVFDEKIAVGASSHLVSARLTGAGVSGAETAVRFEIGRGTGADFVPDPTLGDWMPEEVFREMGADCNSALFALAPADAATVRISAPEFPESGVKEYSVALVAKRERVMAVRTELPEGGFDITLTKVSVGSPFKSGNGQIVVHNGALGAPLVLDLREYNAVLRDTGAGAPNFLIFYMLLGPGHALPSSPYDWAMHVDSLGADEVALPILSSVSLEPAQTLLLFITGDAPDNGSGVSASIEAWEVGNLGPPQVRLVTEETTGHFLAASAVLLSRSEDTASPATSFMVEARLPAEPAISSSSQAILPGIQSEEKSALIRGLDPRGITLGSLVGAQPPSERRISVSRAPSQPAHERFTVYRSDSFVVASGQTTETAIAGLVQADVDPAEPAGEPILIENVATGSRSIRGISGGYTSVLMAFSEESEKLRALNLEPLSIAASSTLDSAVDWPARPWSDVILRPARLMISLLRQTDAPKPEISITATTSRTDSAVVHLALTKHREIKEGIWEYRGIFPASSLIDMGLLKEDNDDGDNEFAIYDYVASTTSSFDDGREFRRRAISLGFTEARGHTEATLTQGQVICFDKTTDPTSPVDLATPANDRFVVPAGVEHLTLKYEEAETLLYQPLPWLVESQADIFYYSGHGVHEKQILAFDEKGEHPLLHLSLLEARWSRDLDLAILAGCSVADVGNFNGNPKFKRYPGQLLAASGCKLILGYNDFAPGDNHFEVKAFTSIIIASFMIDYGTLRAAGSGDAIIRAWIGANITTETTQHIPISNVSVSHGGYNSCGIDTSDPDPANHFYLFYDKTKIPRGIRKVFRPDWPISPK